MPDFDAPALQVVAWETTRRCPLRCRHCRGSARDELQAGELDTGEGKRLIDAVAEAAGRLLIFTGGEPLTRPDLYPLLEYARERGLRTALAACGPSLDERTTERLRRAGVARISVSLDSHAAPAHDRFRGVDGAFAAALAGLDNARRAGLPFQVNTTVTRHNLEHLPQILELVIRLGAVAWDVFFLVPVGRGEQLAGEAMSAEESEMVLRWLAEVRERSPIPVQVTCAPQLARVLAESPTLSGQSARGCMAGRGFLFISHRGVLQPCGFLDVPCGDLRQADFNLSELLRTSPTLAALRHPEDLRGSCGACRYRQACGGCRARAKAAGGDILGPEPTCSGKRGPLWLPPAEAARQLDPEPEARVLHRLQSGLPVEPRPFAGIGRELGLSEEAVMGVAEAALADGRARRLGGIFDPGRIGYASALCAVAVAPDEARETASYLVSVPGITHCYLRKPFVRGPRHGNGKVATPNLWFTLQAPRAEFDAAWADVCERLHPRVPALLPALNRYKIQAVFGADGSVLPDAGARTNNAAGGAAIVLTEAERLAVRILQATLPIASRPFAAAAKQGGISEETLLSAAQKFQSCGALRRIALVARHQLLGYRANAMVVWEVEPLRVRAAGEWLAGRPDVTHCYERRPAPGVPGNLFAMFHAKDWGELFGAVETAEAHCGIHGGIAMVTTREFKKTSMRYAPEAIYTGSILDSGEIMSPVHVTPEPSPQVSGNG